MNFGNQVITHAGQYNAKNVMLFDLSGKTLLSFSTKADFDDSRGILDSNDTLSPTRTGTLPTMNTDHSQDTPSIVEHKVRRRVAKMVLRKIHHQAREIEQQVQAEKRAKRYIIPLLLAMVIIAVIMTSWPPVVRILSTLVSSGQVSAVDYPYRNTGKITHPASTVNTEPLLRAFSTAEASNSRTTGAPTELPLTVRV